jgi:hypothetical protein
VKLEHELLHERTRRGALKGPRKPRSEGSRFDLARVAQMWNDGVSGDDIDGIFGSTGLVARARKKFGVEAVPFRVREKRPEEKSALITSADLGRHYVRALGNGEHVIRDENFIEELWREDPQGIVFGRRVKGSRLTFVIVMGATERRVPESLRHVYPA